ncbi:mitochondrial-processing peptidase subunit alpha [Patella vulgata]|uniref:mitochondrial-processing peptidase subunit alpha n=1 Tax=Patella vulgata TaxID=6465 RepID=UPI0024A7CA2F|nr:mitochondrial-processing peptidase subunit alpha [Patella vulgata]
MATRMASHAINRTCCKYARRRLARAFSSDGGKSIEKITDIPLSKPLPNLKLPQYSVSGNTTHDTHVTVLDNGLTVTSENVFGEFCTVGVAIDSGSRYEVAYPSGISHFLEKLAFGETSQFESRDQIFQNLEKHGGICDCQSSRDTLIYAVSAERSGLPAVINILGEAILRPKITDQELEDTRTAIAFELESLQMRPDPEPILMEMIHAAAFRNNTLGLPKFCAHDNIEKIDRNILYTYLKNVHIPSRTVIAGVGVDHAHLVDLAQLYMVKEKQPIWLENDDLIDKKKRMDESMSQYTGGVVKVEKDLSNVSLGPTPMPELGHVVIGLEGCSHKDPDFIAFCVLNMLMGGGGSFSAGGPGKGMYTRLYLNVLNRYHWIYNATAFNHAYNDSGLFCIYASAHPSQLRELVEVVIKELVNTSGNIYEKELKRAKRQLQSMLMMNLEARPVVFEDLARQVLAAGVRKPPMYYYEQIGKITADDIKRVANRMLRTKPAVAAYGTLDKLPQYDDIEGALASKEGTLQKRFSLFR